MTYLTVCAHDVTEDFEQQILADYKVTVKDRRDEPWSVVFEGDRAALIDMFNRHWADGVADEKLAESSPWLTEALVTSADRAAIENRAMGTLDEGRPAQYVVESIRDFIDEHEDWWDDQVDGAVGEEAKRSLRFWRLALVVPGGANNAATCLKSFVGFVEGGQLDWLDQADVGCLENAVFTEAKGIVDKALGKAIKTNPVALGSVLNEVCYSGKVLSVADGRVTQRVNRDGSTVQHDQKALSVPVAVGDVVEIKYQGGIGKVTERSVEVSQGR